MAHEASILIYGRATAAQLAADDPVLERRELAIALDTYQLYVGDGVNNHAITGGGGSGLTSLNGETGASQTFDKVDDTNVTLSIGSAADVHTFTIAWTGTLADDRIASAGTWNAAAAIVATLGTAAFADTGDFDPAGAAAAVVSDVAYDATSWNGVTGIAPSKNAVRDFLVTLGTAAFTASGDYDVAGAAAAAQAASQPLDGDLTAIAALAGTSGFLTKTAANTWALDTSTYLTAAAADALFLTPAEGDAAYQPLDGDLTAIAALTGTNTIYYRSAANTWTAVTISTGLSFAAGALTATGSGGTVGGSGTDNHLARWNGAGDIQDSNIVVADTTGALTNSAAVAGGNLASFTNTSTTASSTAIAGNATGATGAVIGVYGTTESTDNAAYGVVASRGGTDNAGLFAEGIDVQEMTTPAAPPTGISRIYAKTDSRLYYQSDGGLEVGPLGFQVNITGNAATVTTNANLTGPITSTGNATAIASQTGTGTTFAMSASPTFTGTPAAPTAGAGTSTTQIASTAFVTGAIATAVTGLLEFKGSTDCSANPNYPAASKGDVYIVTVAGKIGGASGKSVDVGDSYIASADNAGGTEAAVGTSWFVLEHNLAGALLAANNLSDVANAATAVNNLGGASSTGSGGLVRATSPALVTPNIGAATATTINGNTITTGTGTLTLSTFTLTVTNTASISGTHTGTSSGTNTGDQTSVSGNAGTVTVADAAADTTTWVLLGTSQTGSLAPATDAGLTYNASTNALITTTFIGALTGNATTATALATGRTISITGDLAYTSPSFDGSGNVTAAGTLATVNANVGSFTNANITVNAKGLITAAANGSGGAVPTTITVADTTDTTCWVALFESATGDLAPKTDVGLTYNASTGVMTATGFAGPLTGNVTGNASGSSGSCTGNAATATALATTRAIYGNNFDGTAALTQVIASTYGGTGNGFAKLSGPATSEKTFTLPNASATILTDATAVTVAQGGTGTGSYTDGQILIGQTTGNTLAKKTIGPGGAIAIDKDGVATFTVGAFGSSLVVSGLALDFADTIPFYDTSLPASARQKVSVLGGFLNPSLCQGRLTLSSANPFYDPSNPLVPNSTDTTAETVTFAVAHGWTTGTMVRVSATAGGLTLDTTYYINATSTTAISFHTTVAGAEAATGKVNLTASITATVIPFGAASTTIRFAILDTGNRVSLFDGTHWQEYAITSEVTLALGTLTSGKNYDAFLYDNAGTLTLELSAAWTSDTARADAVTTLDGVAVKSGATTRRHIGTIRTTSTTTTESSTANRFVSNVNNQLPHRASYITVDAGGAYASATWRSYNNNAVNRISVVNPDTRARTDLTFCAPVQSNALSVPSYALLAIGVDSTSAPHPKSQQAMGGQNFASNAGVVSNPSARLAVAAGLGYHYFQPLEAAYSGNSVIIYGTDGSTYKGGVEGIHWC